MVEEALFFITAPKSPQYCNLLYGSQLGERVSERMCKQVSVSLPLKGDSHDDQGDDYT